MAKFTDALNRAWEIELDPTTADEIQAEFGIDLIDPEGLDDAYLKLSMDARLVVNLAWKFVKENAISREIDETGFKRSMKPSAIRAAREAIVRAITDFSPSPEMAEAMQKVFRAAEKKLAQTLGTLTEEQLMDAMSDGSAGSSPE